MSDDQFNKLEEYLDRRFNYIDKQFKYIDDRFDIMEKRSDFTEQYMRERFDALEAKIDAKADRDQLDRLASTVDGITGSLDTIETELVARNHQVDRHLHRHQNWITQLAHSSHTNLDPAPE